jgi:hypothetical protein
MTWEYLSEDSTRSPQFDELHARLENYQVYSLAWCDQQENRITTNHSPALYLPDVSVLTDVAFGTRTVPGRFSGQGAYFTHVIPTLYFFKLQIPGTANSYPSLNYTAAIEDINGAPGYTLFGTIPQQSILYRPDLPDPTEIEGFITSLYTPYPNLLNHGGSITIE